MTYARSSTLNCLPLHVAYGTVSASCVIDKTHLKQHRSHVPVIRLNIACSPAAPLPPYTSSTRRQHVPHHILR